MRRSRRVSLSTAAALLVPLALLSLPPDPARAAAEVFGAGAPGFITSMPPSSDPYADGAAEPSLGVNSKTGKLLYRAGFDNYRITVNPGPPVTASWDPAEFFPVPAYSLDPILATDYPTGTTLAGADNGPCGGLVVTTDDFETVAPSLPCPGVSDHPTIGFGPQAVDPLNPLTSNGRVAYYCQQYPLLNQCTASEDGGLTWAEFVPQVDCIGLFGHLKSSEVDGTAYVPSTTCFGSDGTGFATGTEATVGGFLTQDNGTSFRGYQIPGAEPPARGFDPSVTVTPDGTLYEAWGRAGDYSTAVTWSSDHGTTWAPIVDLGATVTPRLDGTTFHAMTSGDDGRVAVAYLGVTRTGDPGGLTPFDAGYPGIWHLYVSTSYDAGATWTTTRVTTDPVQRGGINDGGVAAAEQRNLLDFIDAQTTVDGRVAVAYADGCVGACAEPTGTQAQSTGAWATLAVQSVGRGLRSAFDVEVLTAPSAPVLTGSVTPTGTNALAWTVADDGGSPVTSYAVSRATGSGPLVPLATTSSPSYVDAAVTLGTTYRYAVTATNARGTSPGSNAVTLTPTTVPGAPVLSALSGKDSIELTWTAPANGGSPITSYTILRGTSPGSETPLQTISQGTSYVDGTPAARTTYYYLVRADNARGTGPASNSASGRAKK